MKNLRFSEGELTPEQESLIQEAGQTHGIRVEKRASGDFAVCDLTDTQFYTLAQGFEDYWGIPYDRVKCKPTEE